MSIVTIVEIISLIVAIMNLTVDILKLIISLRRQIKAKTLENKNTAFNGTKER